MKAVLGWVLANLEMLVGTGEVHCDNRERHKHDPRFRIVTLTVQPPLQRGIKVTGLAEAKVSVYPNILRCTQKGEMTCDPNYPKTSR